MAVDESFEWSLVHALTSGLEEADRDRAVRIVLAEKYGAAVPTQDGPVDEPLPTPAAPAQRSHRTKPAAPAS